MVSSDLYPVVNGVKKVPITCPHDCGGHCRQWAHVKDGVCIKIESDNMDVLPAADTPATIWPMARACARGLTARRRTYAPDRVKYPMKRVGARGEGKFERISWDEAYDTIAREMIRIKSEHGPGAFLNLQYSGEPYSLQGIATGKLFNKFGGNLQHWGGASFEGKQWAALVTYGFKWAALNSAVAPADARLIVLWGRNPAVTRQLEYGNPHLLASIKENGTRIVCVDPRYTDTAATFADEWVPIIPGTDAAMIIAMAHTIITEELQDKAFVEAQTVGYERFADYVLGREDGVAKTPKWAETITGVRATTIERLARECATTHPAALVAGFGPGRSAYGEQFFRAAMTLAAITGNTDLNRLLATAGNVPLNMYSKGKNPFDVDPSAGKANGKTIDPMAKSKRRVLQSDLFDAMIKGTEGGFPSDVKMAWVAGGNTLTNFPNVNKGVEAFRSLEFVLVSEQFMTATAKFADILLPVTTHLERPNLVSGGDYLYYSAQAIEPLYEAKSDFQICRELAPRLGIDDYADPSKTEEELMFELASPEARAAFPDIDTLKREGAGRWVVRNVALPPGIGTPSGKIEIFSQQVADLNKPELPPLPKYTETWESRNDPLAKKYPLQLLTAHFLLRAHSVFDNIPWLRECEPQMLTINADDAAARGIANGDEVKVFNDRGTVIIRAKVTETMMPGVVNLCEGAWFQPDGNGNDRGGCANVLTKSQSSPVGAWCSHTGLVQVEKHA